MMREDSKVIVPKLKDIRKATHLLMLYSGIGARRELEGVFLCNEGVLRLYLYS